MRSILNFFGLCKKEELDNTKELLRLKDFETEDLLNQIDNLKKFEEVAKQYAIFETKTYYKSPVRTWSEIKVLKTFDDVVTELKKEQLYSQMLENIIDDEDKIIKAVITLNKLLEVRCHENKPRP